MEFYFRFRCRPFRRNLRLLLHQATAFRRNRSTYCGNMTSYPFLKMAAAATQYYFRFRFSWSHCLWKVNILSTNQISSTNLYSRLRYNYFRFWKTNDRHIGILLLVSISTIDYFAVIGALFCIGLPNFIQIGAPTVEIWRYIYVTKWRPGPLNTTSGFVFVNVTAFRRSKSISRPILSTYINSRQRYNYFQFWKTNVRHIGILLPVSISAISP